MEKFISDIMAAKRKLNKKKKKEKNQANQPCTIMINAKN